MHINVWKLYFDRVGDEGTYTGLTESLTGDATLFYYCWNKAVSL